MVEIGPAQTMNVVEERQWTNPRVRFIRKNGRIIPIVNKKRIGEDMNNLGNKALKVGGVAIAGGLAMRPISRVAEKFGVSKKLGNLVTRYSAFNESYKKAPMIRVSSFGNLSKAKPSFGVRGLTFASRLTKAGVMKAARNPIKFGVGLAAAGFFGRAIGAELEMRSPLGKDYGAINE